MADQEWARGHQTDAGGDGSGMNQINTKRKDFEAQALPELEGIYRTALYMTDNESDAQDLVRESIIRAYHSWNKPQSNPIFRVWLFRIMANVLVDRFRPSANLSTAKNNNTDQLDGYLAYSRWVNRQSCDHSGHDPFSGISGDDVQKAIRNLPDEFRLIIVLSLVEGFSYGEIADIAGSNLETVRSRLYQGRKLLQRELFDQAAGEGECEIPAGRIRSMRTG